MNTGAEVCHYKLGAIKAVQVFGVHDVAQFTAAIAAIQNPGAVS